MTDLGEAIARGEKLRLSINARHRKQWGQYITPAKLVAFTPNWKWRTVDQWAQLGLELAIRASTPVDVGVTRKQPVPSTPMPAGSEPGIADTLTRFTAVLDGLRKLAALVTSPE